MCGIQRMVSAAVVVIVVVFRIWDCNLPRNRLLSLCKKFLLVLMVDMEWVADMVAVCKVRGCCLGKYICLGIFMPSRRGQTGSPPARQVKWRPVGHFTFRGPAARTSIHGYFTVGWGGFF